MKLFLFIAILCVCVCVRMRFCVHVFLPCFASRCLLIFVCFVRLCTIDLYNYGYSCTVFLFKVVKHFEILKALCEFPIIIIIDKASTVLLIS